MKRLILGLLACMVVASCGGEDGDSTPVSPNGTWTTTITFGTGSCEVSGNQQEIWTVTSSTSGYVISGSDPKQAFSGTITCSAIECKLSGQWTEPGSSASINASVDKMNVIKGSGSISMTNPDTMETCDKTFTVAGTKS